MVALLLPWVLGISWLSLAGSRLNWQIYTGYGYILGVILTTLLIRGWAFAGLPLSFWAIALAAGVLAIIPVLAKRHLTNPQNTQEPPRVKPGTNWQEWLFAVLLGMLVLRYSGIFLEIIWLPLYPWDAWMNWAPKAKTWFELGELVPFISPDDWASGKQVGYTLGNEDAWPYPPAIPLVQFWSALGLGEWRDDWINVPWLFCSIALGFGFYGQARLMSVAPHIAIAFTYILLSIPYVNIHTLLAGYADIWLATAFGFSTISFFNWVITRDRSQLLLVILFAIVGALMKNPGIAWAATLLPAILLALIPGRWQLLTLCCMLAVLGGIFLSGGIHLDIPKFGPLTVSLEQIEIFNFAQFELEYADVSTAYLANNLLFANWNLFWYLLTGGISWLLITGKIRKIPLPWMVLAISTLGFLFFVFFLIPRYHSEAMHYTTLNRATLHLVPTLTYLGMLIFVLTTDKTRNPLLHFGRNRL